ncbi:hypothetical protein [Anaerobaca lacustris]|uniref:Uncharacterized protein n=1 Tax=Anaerobaca lacustris TaxID=3044600 RepID=A0AAW6U1B4_9BACT|nr:hypothetical protein [Sedimentisphaerales bacterium M17dextr]
MRPQRKEGEPRPARSVDTRPEGVPFTPLTELEHLLKVAASVTQDANHVWTDIWAQVKPLTASGVRAAERTKDGFVPSCGWPEFLEKLWLLKHYLDSVQRICTKQR